MQLLITGCHLSVAMCVYLYGIAWEHACTCIIMHIHVYTITIHPLPCRIIPLSFPFSLIPLDVGHATFPRRDSLLVMCSRNTILACNKEPLDSLHRWIYSHWGKCTARWIDKGRREREGEREREREKEREREDCHSCMYMYQWMCCRPFTCVYHIILLTFSFKFLEPSVC